MKKRMLLITALTAMLVSSGPAISQIQSYAVGGGFAAPTGSFGNSAGIGFGGLVRATYLLEDFEQVLLTGSLGVFRFSGDESLFFGSSLNIRWWLIPIMSGARYYLGKEDASMRPYVGGEIGFHYVAVSLSDNLGNSSVGFGNSTNFAIQPLVGVQLGALDIWAQYTLANLNYFGLQAAFHFSKNKK